MRIFMYNQNMSIIDKIIDSVIEKGGRLASFSIKFPNGSIKKAGKGKDEFVINIKSKEVYSEVLKKGDLGLGEQYMLGNLDIEGDFIKALTTITKSQSAPKESLLQNLLIKSKKVLIKNNRNNALKNVAYHYDLGNEFYEKWLDKRMMYSCAYFKSMNDSIDTAQEQKLEHICRKLMLKKGETLIDIGCGWGGMLIYAAQKYKVKGYGVSLSKEQIKYANSKAKELGVSNLVKFELKDYRDIKGKFDKVVSIGMFEHVGKEFHDVFFNKVKEILVPGGIGLVHTIGVDKPMNPSNYEWMNTYVFPGTYLPTPMQLFAGAIKSDFVPFDFESLRFHYSLTLRRWLTNYEKIFDETSKERGMEFARMWRLYLNVTIAAFQEGEARLFQLTFSNGIKNDLPLTRDHLYI